MDAQQLVSDLWSAIEAQQFDRGLPVSGCEARESISVAGLGGVGLRLVAGVHFPSLRRRNSPRIG